ARTAGRAKFPSVSASPRIRTHTSFAAPFPSFSTVKVASVHSFTRAGATSRKPRMLGAKASVASQARRYASSADRVASAKSDLRSWTAWASFASAGFMSMPNLRPLRTVVSALNVRSMKRFSMIFADSTRSRALFTTSIALSYSPRRMRSLAWRSIASASRASDPSRFAWATFSAASWRARFSFAARAVFASSRADRMFAMASWKSSDSRRVLASANRFIPDLRDLVEEDPQVRDGIGCMDRRVERLDVIPEGERLAAVGDEVHDDRGPLAEVAQLSLHALDRLLRDLLLQADPFCLGLALEGRRNRLAILLRPEQLPGLLEQLLRGPRVGPLASRLR